MQPPFDNCTIDESDKRIHLRVPVLSPSQEVGLALFQRLVQAFSTTQSIGEFDVTLKKQTNTHRIKLSVASYLGYDLHLHLHLQEEEIERRSIFGADAFLFVLDTDPQTIAQNRPFYRRLANQLTPSGLFQSAPVFPYFWQHRGFVHSVLLYHRERSRHIAYRDIKEQLAIAPESSWVSVADSPEDIRNIMHSFLQTLLPRPMRYTRRQESFDTFQQNYESLRTQFLPPHHTSLRREEAFAALRGLLSAQKPRQVTWEALCSLFAMWPEEEDLQRGIHYAREHTMLWPAKLRILPPLWIRALLEGHDEPRISLASYLPLILYSDRSYPAKHQWFRAPLLKEYEAILLAGSGWKDKTITQFLKTSDWKRLTSLSLHYILNKKHAKMIAKADHFRSLTSLNLHANPIGTAGFTSLIRSKHLKGLQQLNVSTCDLEERALDTWSQGSELTSLTTLDLSQNQLSPSSLYALADIPSLRTLQTLRLDHIPLHTGTRALASCTHFTELKTLSLRDCSLDDQDVTLLLNDASRLQLKDLHLQGNHISEGFLLQLFDQRMEHPSLRIHLDISDCSQDVQEVLLSSRETPGLQFHAG
ncbi:MAG TPA: hypothetical protein DCE42_04105 [Myxococcales bacterium]|nr:hypothetical protein [Deltaproteobacteria bacterium]HAA53910.1 hypothetical protein [Myxococcales bacterium]|tara:strand:+ start:40748 stop:42511 length:1764 start_codon:yes stop_codon:yes gene_type:complete